MPTYQQFCLIFLCLVGFETSKLGMLHLSQRHFSQCWAYPSWGKKKSLLGFPPSSPPFKHKICHFGNCTISFAFLQLTQPYWFKNVVLGKERNILQWANLHLQQGSYPGAGLCGIAGYFSPALRLFLNEPLFQQNSPLSCSMARPFFLPG